MAQKDLFKGPLQAWAFGAMVLMLWPGLRLAAAGMWGLNQQKRSLSVSVSLLSNRMKSKT